MDQNEMRQKLMEACKEEDWFKVLQTMANNPGDNGSIESMLESWAQDVTYMEPDKVKKPRRKRFPL